MDKLTTNQKQNYEAIKAMGEKKGTDPTTMTQEQRDNPRWRIWTLLHYVRGRPLMLPEIMSGIRLNITYTAILEHLNDLVAAGKVAHDTHDWWVVDPLERPSMQ